MCRSSGAVRESRADVVARDPELPIDVIDEWLCDVPVALFRGVVVPAPVVAGALIPRPRIPIVP